MAARQDARPDERPAAHRRMTKRPTHLDPSELPENPPVPEPRAAAESGGQREERDPTRYGDWELKGVAIDF